MSAIKQLLQLHKKSWARKPNRPKLKTIGNVRPVRDKTVPGNKTDRKKRKEKSIHGNKKAAR